VNIFWYLLLCSCRIKYLGGVWFDCFLFLFSLKIENGDDCLVGFLKTFSVKIKTGNNQKMKTINSRFSVFS